jgi:hypothetical protein
MAGAVVFLGSGVCSVDHLVWGRKKKAVDPAPPPAAPTPAAPV